jgi:hypothetical protein
MRMDCSRRQCHKHGHSSQEKCHEASNLTASISIDRKQDGPRASTTAGMVIDRNGQH